MTEEKKNTNFTVILLAILLVVASFLAGSFFTKIKTFEKGQKAESLPKPSPVAQVKPSPAVLGMTIGNFSVTKDGICLEDGKPVVYFFGSESCPHCSWEHPIMEKVMASFGDKISFHNNMDKAGVDQEIWNKYSQINQGGIPFLVFGCKYARVGSGEQMGEEKETDSLTALLCKLTNGQPEKVCAGVKELTSQIRE